MNGKVVLVVIKKSNTLLFLWYNESGRLDILMDKILPSEGRDIGSIPILDTNEYVKSNEVFGFFFIKNSFFLIMKL